MGDRIALRNGFAHPAANDKKRCAVSRGVERPKTAASRTVLAKRTCGIQAGGLHRQRTAVPGMRRTTGLQRENAGALQRALSALAELRRAFAQHVSECLPSQSHVYSSAPDPTVVSAPRRSARGDERTNCARPLGAGKVHCLSRGSGRQARRAGRPGEGTGVGGPESIFA